MLGLAESSLLPAFYLSQKLNLKCKFGVTTRESIKTPHMLHFKELHSHAPDHQILLPDDHTHATKYDCVLVVEDEITTGIFQFRTKLLTGDR